MDKILRIYDGSGANYIGDGSLLYEVQGGMLDYRFIDKSNYEIDTLTAVLANVDYDIDVDDVWRLIALDGTIIGSGFIEKEPVTGVNGNLEIQGLGWTGLLTRRLVEDEEYSAKTGEYIFEDILSSYFSEYSIDTTEIATPSNTITNRYDNQYAYDVIKEVMMQSYGANDKQFDFYLYEAAAGTIKAKAFERELAAVSETITPGHIKPIGFNVRARGDLIGNYVIVKGLCGDPDPTPTDNDRWTDMSSTDFSNYPNVWTCSSGDTVRQETTEKILGDESVFLGKLVSDGDMYARLNLHSGDAYTLDSHNMVSGLGYKKQWDGTKQSLHFSMYSNVAIDVRFRLCYNYGGSNYYLNYTFALNGEKWVKFDKRIMDIIGSDEWDVVRTLQWDYPSARSGTDQFYVDNLYFYDLVRFRGVKDGSATPRKDVYFQDDGLKTNAECVSIAEDIYNAIVLSQYEGSFLLSRKINDLRAGDNIALQYPQKGIDIAKIPIQQIEWTPGNQMIHAGRHKSLSEILSETRNEIKRRT